MEASVLVGPNRPTSRCGQGPKRKRREALIEKAEDGPPGLRVWRTVDDPESSRLSFAKAYDAFENRLGLMNDAMVDLEDAGYAGQPRPAN